MVFAPKSPTLAQPSHSQSPAENTDRVRIAQVADMVRHRDLEQNNRASA